MERIIYVFAAMTAFLTVLLSLPSRQSAGKDCEDNGAPRGLRWLARAAARIQARLPQTLLSTPFLNAGAAELAEKLDPGLRRNEFILIYQRKKIMVIYGLGLLTLYAAVIISAAFPKTVLDNNRLERDSADGVSRIQDVTAEIGGQEEELAVAVDPRVYDEKQRSELIKKAKAYIDSELPGENSSLEDVKYPLNFVSSYPGENVTIEWECDDYNLISQDGRMADLSEVSLPVSTSVTAFIRYASFVTEYTKSIRITEYKQSEEASLLERLQKAVERSDEASRERGCLLLPEEIDGQKISWSYTDSSAIPLIILVCAGAMFGIPAYMDERLKKEAEHRREMLFLDYPLFVHRMVLMLGAGITARSSWKMLLAELKKEERRSGRTSYLCRELNYSYLQINSGVPEVTAYREFGNRTGLPCYEQFSQLLIQSVKKGRRGIEDMMMEEAENARRNRRDTAKKLGETAGTKLLLPMIMLLIVVVAIVMIPALIEM